MADSAIRHRPDDYAEIIFKRKQDDEVYSGTYLANPDIVTCNCGSTEFCDFSDVVEWCTVEAAFAAWSLQAIRSYQEE